MTTHTTRRVLEALELFNSRTCQVVLGTSAMRSAGLKNIAASILVSLDGYNAPILIDGCPRLGCDCKLWHRNRLLS